MKKNKHGLDIIEMTFNKQKYANVKKTSFTFAWKHPLITCRLCIKYFITWFFSINSPGSPRVHRYYIYLWALYVRTFLWLYIGLFVGVLFNNKPDAIRLVTEIPLTAGIAFSILFTPLLLLRPIIYILELIRIVKKDNRYLYGLGVVIIYGLLGVITLGFVLS